MPFVQESLVVEQNKKLIALVFPDFDAADKAGYSNDDLEKVIEANRVEVNKILPSYCQIVKLKLYPEEFEKTPKKSIKRFLYQFPQN